MTANQINACNTQTQLSNLVESYLKSIGEYENSRSESYKETADRTGDKLLAVAETKWFELENANWGGSRPGAGRKPGPVERKTTSFKVTEEEKEKIRELLAELRK